MLIFSWVESPSGPRPILCWRSAITLGKTPLDEWSARRRDLYLTTHNTHNRQTSTLPAGIEPAIPASERPQTHAWDRAATGNRPAVSVVPFDISEPTEIWQSATPTAGPVQYTHQPRGHQNTKYYKECLQSLQLGHQFSLRFPLFAHTRIKGETALCWWKIWIASFIG